MNINMSKDRANKVKAIRDQDIIPVLENAVSYGYPWDTLYCAAIEEITELRKQVLEMGGTLPLKTGVNGIDYAKLNSNIRS